MATTQAGPVPATMVALVQDRWGDDPRAVLRAAEVPVPRPGPGEVLVRVRAAGLDQGTWHLLAGLPLPVRLGAGLRRPRAANPARALAGEVAALGTGVTGLAVGARVHGSGTATLAPFAVARADRLAPLPAGLDAVPGAALPISGASALQAVRDVAAVRPGERVLVVGAAGGVGHLAMQVAVALGAEVTGVCRPEAADLVRSLGAGRVVDRSRDDLRDGGPAYDVVVDTGGHRPLRSLRAALTPRGRLVVVGSETGGRLLGGLDRTLRAALLSPFVGQRLGTFVGSERGTLLAGLDELVTAGQVRPVVADVLPLAAAADGLARLRAGGVHGKLVVTP
ncbi:NAD(P)-dependent alcohol dehydrogenase [Cellulomonas endophytica]|uniref:NAD(P)-dependent alcohol dehydrogenase n=1 Tax=Cellulomonas endophytica TaxID=2494735 RepID=UPI00196A9CA0|nr:NAD(P)-dependent alcohol dehydrogenase [Cellulomonas endophytica]